MSFACSVTSPMLLVAVALSAAAAYAVFLRYAETRMTVMGMLIITQPYDHFLFD